MLNAKVYIIFELRKFCLYLQSSKKQTCDNSAQSMKTIFDQIKVWLASLSYRTGVIVLIACLLFYVISFAQMLLPISVAAKGTLWVIFFGLAKTAQYSALLILGKAGIESIRKRWHRNRVEDAG